MIETMMLGILIVAAPATATRDFEAGNERALAGDVAQAEALYRSVLEQGYEDADVYYNLGHVLEETQPLEAILAYERALALDPGDTEARSNLSALRTRFAPKAPSPPEGAESGGSFAAAIRSTTPAAAWLAALSFFAAGLMLALRGPKGRSGALLLGLAGLVGLGGLALGLSFAPPDQAVIREDARLREGPDPRFGVRGGVVTGESVIIESRDGDFVEVRRVDGTAGWIPREKLEEL